MPTSMDSLLPLCALPPSHTNAYSCSTPLSQLLDLADPFFCPATPFSNSLDLIPTMATSSPASKKRKSLHQHVFNDHPSNDRAGYGCADLEELINFLWMEDDSGPAAAQSDASLEASSEQFPLLNDVYWENCSNDNSSFIAECSAVKVPLTAANIEREHHNDDQCDQACQQVEGLAWVSCSVKGSNQNNTEGPCTTDTSSCCRQVRQHDTEVLPRKRWQEQRLMEGLQVNGQRGNWQDGIRSSWQDVPSAGARASWQGQEKQQASARASWQAAETKAMPSMASCRSEPRAAGSWAGPTLLDIESALALSSPSYSTNNSSPSCCISSEPPTPASSCTSTSAKHTSSSPLLDLTAILLSHHGDFPAQADCPSESWRLKLQKRSSQEPKYAIRVESEEKALGDGYRWRKYGQKSIKNSPFPRSYYRCSTGNCGAKKQVEKCQDEECPFLVTYEGIHLHHKPTMLVKLRTVGEAAEDEKEKFSHSDKEKCPSSPSSSTSVSCSIPPHD